MDSFFGNMVRAKFDNQQACVKQKIIETLSDNAKEIQYELKEELIPNEMGVEQLDLCDHTQSLCATIEAIFLHGLKDSFLWQTLTILTGVENAVNRRPTPTFWAPLLIFSHKYAIEQIHQMNQLKNEVGYCRCWIRQSLNDCLLSSYISNMRKNVSSLKPYYRNYAFVRDAETMELAESLIGGIEACVSFQLPLNSSLLNYWPDIPLQLSGLYTPSIQTCPIASAIDVVNSEYTIIDTKSIPQSSNHDLTINEQTLNQIFIDRSISIPKPLQINELFADSIHNSPLKESIISRKNLFIKPYNDLEEVQEPTNIDVGIECGTIAFSDDIEHDVQLAAFLERVDALQQMPSNAHEQNAQNDNDINIKINENESESNVVNIDEPIDATALTETEENLMGNSITFGRGWSSDEQQNNQLQTSNASDAANTNPKSLSRSSSVTIRSPIDHHSYNSLLRRDKTKHEMYSRQIDFNDVWQRFEHSLGLISNSPDIMMNENNINIDKADELSDEFEIVEAESISSRFKMSELREMVQQTFKIPREHGLESQNFACLSCGNPLGVGGSGQTTTQVCGFNGAYYCTACMAIELYYIPSRVIFNWDFRKYAVSQKAATFFQEFQEQPFIDLKILNPSIYQHVEEMAELQSLRIQLNFIRAYLTTCSDSIMERLQKQLWTKEYLYEHIHRYTLVDLQRIPKRLLADQLRKVVTFGRQHIYTCVLCRQKGFICEICRSNNILYPFDIDTTFKCNECGAVFHAECLNQTSPCPRCERKEKRLKSTSPDLTHEQVESVEETIDT